MNAFAFHTAVVVNTMQQDYCGEESRPISRVLDFKICARMLAERSILKKLAVGLSSIIACTIHLASIAESQETIANDACVAKQILGSVKEIFVGSLDPSTDAEIIRQKLIYRLTKSGVVTTSETEEAADAILTGGASIDHHNYLVVSNGFVSSGSKYHAEGVLRLIDKNKNLLWTEEIASRKYFPPHSAHSASANVADKIVTKLVTAITADKQSVAANTEPDQSL